jgi:hypothetical protein
MQQQFVASPYAVHLTNRWSEPLTDQKITKVKLESRKLKRKLAPASGG